MQRSLPRKVLASLALAMGLCALLAGEARAMRRGPEGATEETKSFKELVLDREMARDRARDRLMGMSQPASDASVTVKIRRKGENSKPGSRGEVIAQGKISKEEAEKGGLEVYEKVKASAGVAAAARPAASSRRPRPFETSERERTAVWSLAALLGLGLLGWWYSRRFQAI